MCQGPLSNLAAFVERTHRYDQCNFELGIGSCNISSYSSGIAHTVLCHLNAHNSGRILRVREYSEKSHNNN